MKYAVVNMSPANGRFSFSTWHLTERAAFEEAARLCQNESKEFVVLKVIGRAELVLMPVKVTREE